MYTRKNLMPFYEGDDKQRFIMVERNYIQVSKIKFKLFVFIIAFFNFFYANALKMKYEPSYSYGLNTGANMHLHPYSESGLDPEFQNYNKNNAIYPFVSMFLQKRFFDQILGTTIQILYNNRRFSHSGVLEKNLLTTDLHCIDIGILLNLLPKGYGGINIYIGPQMYYLLSATSHEYNYRSVLVSEEDLYENFNKYNFGLNVGFNLEIDRTGFLIGLEYDYFFNQINSSTQVTKDDVLSVENEAFLLSNVKKTSSFRIYIGYDFARLHCGP